MFVRIFVSFKRLKGPEINCYKVGYFVEILSTTKNNFNVLHKDHLLRGNGRKIVVLILNHRYILNMTSLMNFSGFNHYKWMGKQRTYVLRQDVVREKWTVYSFPKNEWVRHRSMRLTRTDWTDSSQYYVIRIEPFMRIVISDSILSKRIMTTYSFWIRFFYIFKKWEFRVARPDRVSRIQILYISWLLHTFWSISN